MVRTCVFLGLSIVDRGRSVGLCASAVISFLREQRYRPKSGLGLFMLGFAHSWKWIVVRHILIVMLSQSALVSSQSQHSFRRLRQAVSESVPLPLRLAILNALLQEF